MYYTRIEQKINGYLNRFPHIRNYVKTIYNTFNYLAYGAKELRYTLHPMVKINEVYPTLVPSFLGYYDISPWNESLSEYLLHFVVGNGVALGKYEIDTQRVSIFNYSVTWNYQQGSRLSWIPNSNSVIFNAAVHGNLIAKKINFSSNSVKYYTYPVQSVAANGQKYLTINYHRLRRLNPAYAYNNYIPKNSDEKESCIRLIDIKSSNDKILHTLEELLMKFAISKDPKRIELNHLIFSPNSEQYIGILRYNNGHGKNSIMFLGYINKDEIKIITKKGYVSHYAWLDDDRIIIWLYNDTLDKGYYIYNISTGSFQRIHVPDFIHARDGHPSVSPDRRWVSFDTYPDRRRMSTLYLFNLNKKTLTEIGKFYSPLRFQNQSRCDLHPRWSPDGRKISIDSTHLGKRANFIVDVTGIVAE